MYSKPKYEEFEPKSKNIEEQAANAWKYYLMRNKSIIVDLFQVIHYFYVSLN